MSIAGAPEGLLRYIIIIPAYCEPDIILTLESIRSQNEIQKLAEVIILFNYSEEDHESRKKENESEFLDVQDWCNNNPTENITFHPIIIRDLPHKTAGAGMARKIAMDLAVERFNQLDKPDGIILSADADTLLPKNYLESVEQFLQDSLNINTLIFNFEHDIEGSEFNPEIYQSAILYELHMRYYRSMLEKTGFPYPFFTVGSCFGVKAGIYSKIGGMNRRKAGEDFYFLQKIFPFGHVKFLKHVVLHPSSRPSWRVPFGTGPAIRKIIDAKMNFKTYNPKAFFALKEFFDLVPVFYELGVKDCLNKVSQLNSALQQFLQISAFEPKLSEIKNNSSNQDSFAKRFFAWSDAFWIIKFLNFTKDDHFPEVKVVHAIKAGLNIQVQGGEKELLMKLREADRIGKV